MIVTPPPPQIFEEGYLGRKINSFKMIAKEIFEEEELQSPRFPISYMIKLQVNWFIDSLYYLGTSFFRSKIGLQN